MVSAFYIGEISSGIYDILVSIKNFPGTSLVVQWLRIHLPMQGTQDQSLVREDPSCRGATKPTCHSYQTPGA